MLKNRLKKVEQCIEPLKEQKKKERTAEEWIEHFKIKSIEAAPILRPFYAELVKALNGRHIWEEAYPENDYIVKGLMGYIADMVTGFGIPQKKKEYLLFPEDQVKDGASKMIEAIKTYSDLMLFHDCEDCGCTVPNTPISFEKCPFCGGKTGWAAYYYKHKEYFK